MKRGCAWAFVAVVVAAGGCASPARYVEKQGDSGVVAIPNNTDNWPSYNRREAIALIQKHVGPNFELVDEREVVTGQTTNNNQQVNTEQTVNSRFPLLLPAERQTVTNTTTQHDVTEWRIAYRKKARPEPLINEQPSGGVTPTSGQTAQPGAGVVPSVQPAGALLPRGTGSYTIPTPRPGGAPAAADCNH